MRSVQTAGILAEGLSYIGPVIATDELSPGFDDASLRTLWEKYQQVDELVLLVGAEPDLGGAVASLLSLHGGFDYKKGSASKLKMDAESGKPAAFKWLASGKIFKRSH